MYSLKLVISRIYFKYFILSFCIGMFLCYIFTPPPKIVFKYPNFSKKKANIYRDKSKNCYHYRPNKIKCPKDPTSITQYNIKLFSENKT